MGRGPTDKQMSTEANWSNLLVGGRSRSASSRGSVRSITGSPRQSESTFSFTSPALLFLLLLVVIVVVAVRTRTTTSVAASSAQPEAAPIDEVVVQTVSVEPDQPAQLDETVQPKFAALTNKWFNSEVDDLDVAVPLGDSEAGYSFQDFQRALLSSDSRANVTGRHHDKSGGYAHDQLQPLKDMITKSGRSLDQFVSENMITLPEEVMEMWSAPSSTRPVQQAFTRPECTAEEANMLVREALQDVPTSDVNDAAMVLREVLHARTEGAKLRVQMPEVPQEQRISIKHWAVSGQQPAADIASVILSRS